MALLLAMHSIRCFPFSSLLHALCHNILNGLFPEQCVEFIQFCQAVKLFWRVMEVERAVPSIRVFKNWKVCKIFFFSGSTWNSWQKRTKQCHAVWNAVLKKFMFFKTLFPLGMLISKLEKNLGQKVYTTKMKVRSERKQNLLLASHSEGVAILLVVSCYRIRGSCATLLSQNGHLNTSGNYLRCETAKKNVIHTTRYQLLTACLLSRRRFKWNRVRRASWKRCNSTHTALKIKKRWGRTITTNLDGFALWKFCWQAQSESQRDKLDPWGLRTRRTLSSRTCCTVHLRW